MSKIEYIGCKKYHITLTRGDDEFIIIRVDGADDYTWFFTVKPLDSETEDDTDALLLIDDADVVKDDEKALIPIAKSDTPIEPGVYKYDLQYIKNDIVKTLMGGTYTVYDDVTKRVE